MIICVCHRVSDRDIAREVAAGCRSFDDLQESLRIATACGACSECAQETFDEHAARCGGGCPCSARHVPAACGAVPIAERHRFEHRQAQFAVAA